MATVKQAIARHLAANDNTSPRAAAFKSWALVAALAIALAIFWTCAIVGAGEITRRLTGG